MFPLNCMRHLYQGAMRCDEHEMGKVDGLVGRDVFAEMNCGLLLFLHVRLSLSFCFTYRVFCCQCFRSLSVPAQVSIMYVYICGPRFTPDRRD